MGFDQVEIDQMGGRRTLSRDDFFKIDLDTRIDLLCKGWVQFFREGKPISPLEAMKKTEGESR